MLKVIYAPAEISDFNNSLFLAGGITGCPDWQKDLISLLRAPKTQTTIFNPRRMQTPPPEAAEEQIIWEHKHLLKVNAVSFWFPKETLCPITLYELGVFSERKTPIFVGTHPEYKRKEDVRIQLKLARPDVGVVDSIEGLADKINRYIEIFH